MPYRQTVTIERSGLSYCVRPGRRSGKWIWWSEADMPEFAKAGGRFVIERIPGQLRPGWKVIAPDDQASGVR